MNTTSLLVPLGFTREHFPAGTHICQIYDSPEERDDSLLKFLLSGLRNSERVSCFSDAVDRETMAVFLQDHGVSIDTAIDNGELSLAAAGDVYFENGEFDLANKLDQLRQFEIDSKASGCSSCRVIGEMDPRIKEVAGGTRLIEYEARVSILLREHPITTVCQYDVNQFDGKTILDVLRVHPMMVVHGQVKRNPFFITPEQFLEQLQH